MSLKQELFLAALRSKTADRALKGAVKLALGKVSEVLPRGSVQAWAAEVSGKPVKVPA